MKDIFVILACGVALFAGLLVVTWLSGMVRDAEEAGVVKRGQGR